MKYHITWTPELKSKINRAVALYRTANDNASSPEEVKTANMQLVALARNLKMSVAKLRSAVEQHIDSEAPKTKKQSGNSYTPSPKATQPQYANPEGWINSNVWLLSVLETIFIANSSTCDRRTR